MDVRWKDGFEIRVHVSDGATTVSANRDGMLSLANILLDLAEADVGTHVHLDQFNSLCDGSCDLIVERTP